MASDPAALRKQAQEHFASQRWDAALAVYDELLDLDRDDAGALAGRGAVRIQLGKLKGAVDDLGRSLALKPDQSHVRFNRGLALTKLGRFEDALADFEAYLAADPKDADGLRHRARCRAELGEVEEHDGRLVAAPSALANVPRGCGSSRRSVGAGWRSASPSPGACSTRWRTPRASASRWTAACSLCSAAAWSSASSPS